MKQKKKQYSINDQRLYSGSLSKKEGLRISEQTIASPIGLINMGNTCFLNSIIQFIFGIQELRQDLIEYRSMQIRNLSRFLGEILFLLRQKKSEYWQMTNVLQRISEFLINANIRFSRYSQESSLYILSQILSLVEKERQKQQLKVSISYKAGCDCQQLCLKERFISYEPMQCVDCKKYIKRILLRPPRKIIYSNPLKQNILQEKQEQSENQALIYTYKAQIIYFGNGDFGHYIARRIQGDFQFQFNDFEVKPMKRCEKGKSRGFLGSILLYQKSPKSKFDRQQSGILSGFDFQQKLRMRQQEK